MSIIVLGLTGLKVNLVAYVFMEVGDGPRWLKVLVGSWVVVVFVVVGVLVSAPE